VGQAVIETLMQRMLRPDAPVMIFAGYPEEMAKFEMTNKGLASRIPYRFEFADFNATALAKIFRFKVERSGFDLASDMSDSELEYAFDEMVSRNVCAQSNGRLCETALKFAKEELDLECTREGEVSSIITIDHIRKGLVRASEWGTGIQAFSKFVSAAHPHPVEVAGPTENLVVQEPAQPLCKERELAIQ